MFAKNASYYRMRHAVRQDISPQGKRLATLRVYEPGLRGIHVEEVIGGFIPRGQRQPIVVVRPSAGRPAQCFQLAVLQGFARHLGDLPQELRTAFDGALPGGSFDHAGSRYERLEDERVAALVYRLPVWHAAHQPLERLLPEVRARIPADATVLHCSLMEAMPKDLSQYEDADEFRLR